MENLTHVEANLDNEFPEYDLGTMTDETLDEMAAEMDREELADLANAIDELLRLSDRADRETAPNDRAEVEAQRDKKLLNIQQLMVSISADMGLMNVTPELYERLYGKRAA